MTDLGVDAIRSYLGGVIGDMDDWQLDELAEDIGRLDPMGKQAALDQLPVIWPVSSALFMAFVPMLAQASACLQPDQIPLWVHGILDVYEAEGLRKAQLYMEKVEDVFLCELRGETGLSLAEAKSRLGPYLRGLTGRDIVLEPAMLPQTDTETLYLPREMGVLPSPEENFLLYKLTATFHMGLELYGSFAPCGADDLDLLKWWQDEKTTEADQELFWQCETIRVMGQVCRHFSGLVQDIKPLLPKLAQGLGVGLFADMQRGLLMTMAGHRGWAKSLPPEAAACLGAHYGGDVSVHDSMRLTLRLREIPGLSDQVAETGRPLLFQGRFLPQDCFPKKERRRLEVKNRFMAALAAFLAQEEAGHDLIPAEQEERHDHRTESANSEEGAAMILAGTSTDEPVLPEFSGDGFVTLDSEELRLPPELAQLVREIRQDQGTVPREYISSAVGYSSGLVSMAETAEDPQDIQELEGPLVFAEWDYRRQGFRKNWCKLLEKEVVPVGGSFVAATLAKYRGQILHLRRQFEMLQNQDRFMRGQKDGDELDFDALLGALADQKAGIPASDRLFIRLQRLNRDIGVLFLVDMSSSTEGWISTALKESLIMMCEALEVLGDRYGIYGFSGMRRSRCELFKVKGFTDPYSQIIKAKIAGISPREYTRMGPPIRHSTHLLQEVDVKTRLLVILSDGKPEDYDDYKGLYAIEDTRHALIEAKMAGVHPFCITVDHEAHDYMAHLFGEVNYVFINDVTQLPKRIPEIYRNLTT